MKPRTSPSPPRPTRSKPASDEAEGAGKLSSRLKLYFPRISVALLSVLLVVTILATAYEPPLPVRTAPDLFPGSVESEPPFVRFDPASPRLVGIPLKLFSYVIRMPWIGPIIVQNMKRANDFASVTSYANRVRVEPVFYPTGGVVPAAALESARRLASETSSTELVLPPASKTSFSYLTSADYVRAYASGKETPVAVVERLSRALPALNARLGEPVLQFLEADALQQAQASTLRYQQGKPLSLLDGVPVLVKEQLHVIGYNQTFGTTFYPRSGPSTRDEVAVARLRAAGALLVGMVSMHEWGVGVTGANPSRGTTFNPHDTNFYPGGSSGGSAAVVAAGLVPLSLGTDGGGSIRIPSALCGVAGLKPTFQRVDFASPYTVVSVGPIASSVRDVALAYSIVGDAPANPAKPAPHLQHFNAVRDLGDVRVCLMDEYAKFSSNDVRETLGNVVEWLKGLGAKTEQVRGVSNLPVLIKAHALTIFSEMATNLEDTWNPHAGDLSPETIISMSVGRSFTAREYVSGAKVKGWFHHVFQRVFKEQKCDVILLPATGTVAPRIPRGALLYGEGNLAQTAEITRFSAIANFLGLPAGVVAAGFDPHELPVSVQVMGNHWDEAKVLRVMHAIEVQAVERGVWPRKPAVVAGNHRAMNA